MFNVQPSLTSTTMLPPDQSPVHQLGTLWRALPPPKHHDIPACRARLFTAATHEITAHANAGKSYDPMTDQRFHWAAQWIDVGDGSRPSIDPNVESILTLILTPCPAARKLAAANDT